nr:ATP-binding protein [Nocardioides panaciterrulae]
MPITGGWSWRGSILMFAVLLHPYLLVLALPSTGAERLHTADEMSRLLATNGILAAAVILKYEWRLTRRASTGWLAMALGFQAAQTIPFALLSLQAPAAGRFDSVVGTAQVPATVVVLALVAMAARGTWIPVRNPLTTGLLLGGAVAAARLVLFRAGLDPSLALDGPARVVDAVLVALVVVATIVVLSRSHLLPGWARLRFGAFLGCLVASRLLATGSPSQLRSALSVLVLVAGVAALLGAAAVMLRQGIRDNVRQLATLAHRAAAAEVNVRDGRERMHELHATVAGIAQASRLLLHGGGPSGGQRRRLEALLDSEMARLERMLSRRGRQPVGAVCLDELLRPLVETQLTLGADIDLEPTPLRVLGRADDLAEVVHILLSNAARHAPGAPVTVRASRTTDGRTEVRVADQGPGVPASLRASLFTWGGRRAGSPGQGIGLQLAKRLMLEQAGNLTLEDRGRPGGATFVLTIPSCPPGTP